MENAKSITTGPTIDELRQYVFNKYKLATGWQSKFAKECKISPSLVSAVFLGRRKIPEEMANVIGWRLLWTRTKQ